MSLQYVTLTCDLFDGRGNAVNGGTATFTPGAQLTDTTDHEIITQAGITASFKSTGSPVVRLLATDNGNPLPTGWAWTVTFSGVPGNPAGFSFFLPYTGGAAQNLSAVTQAGTVPVTYLPLRLFYADAYGADPTGASDSAAAFTAAQTAAGSSPYLLVLSAGTYRLDSALTAFGRNQGMTGPGSPFCTIDYRGSGSCISVYDSSFSPASSIGGRFGGFRISGVNNTSGGIGMQWGNMLMARCHDIAVASCPGGGIYLKNETSQVTWSERGWWTSIELTTNGNYQACFDTGSFDYSVYEFVMTAGAGADGLRMQNDASIEGCRVELRGNFEAGSANDDNAGAVFALDRGNASGTSRINAAQMYVDVECDGSSGTGHTTILHGGGSAGKAAFLGVGVLQFNDETVAFTPMSVAAPVQFGFSGRVYENSIGKMDPGDALAVQGGSQWNEYGSLSTAFPGTLFLKFGDIQAFQLASGAQTLAFSAQLQRSRKIDLYLAQPPSGSAGTVTWPSNVIFPGGGAPTLSQVNGAVDHVRLVYLPSESNWYAELAGIPSDGTAAVAEVDVAVTAETVIATYPLPANLPAGATYRIKAWLTVAVGGTGGTFTSRMRLGGLSGAVISGPDTSASLSSSATGVIIVEGIITLRAPSSTATYAGCTEMRGTVGATAIAGQLAGTLTKNSTVTQQLVLTVALGSSTMSVACLGSVCERVPVP